MRNDSMLFTTAGRSSILITALVVATAVGATVVGATAVGPSAVGDGAVGPQGGTHNSSEDAWETLTATRNALAHAPLAIPFEQTFVPAGFSSGDRETGVAAFGLPECVRWDYLDPDPRSYLLCGDTVLTWNHGEDSGRRLRLDGEESGPFELWLAPLADLKLRYRAELGEGNGDHLTVRVTPSGAAGFDTAEVLVDRGTRLPIHFEYRDFEGNATSFDFAEAEPLDGNDRRFNPPSLHWIEESE